MKKWLVSALVLILLLCGCSQTDYETIADEYTPLAPGEKAQMVLRFSGDTEASAMESGEQESIYFCDGFTLTKQTLESGDLDKTLRAVTGYSREKIRLIQQNQENYRRYDFVWSCAGEGGDQICRGSILDDGNYHYVVTTMAPEGKAGELQQTWNELFSSFTLNIEPLPSGTEQ